MTDEEAEKLIPQVSAFMIAVQNRDEEKINDAFSRVSARGMAILLSEMLFVERAEMEVKNRAIPELWEAYENRGEIIDDLRRRVFELKEIIYQKESRNV